MSRLDLKLPPIALVLILGQAMWAAAAWAPALEMPLPWRGVLGAALFAAGVLLVLAAGVRFRAQGTTMNPTRPEASSALVVSGVYRLSRNPMYVGALLALVGWATYLAHPLAFVFLPVFVAWMNRYQIAPEERALAARFGSEYEAYRKAVRRWL